MNRVIAVDNERRSVRIVSSNGVLLTFIPDSLVRARCVARIINGSRRNTRVPYPEFMKLKNQAVAIFDSRGWRFPS